MVGGYISQIGQAGYILRRKIFKRRRKSFHFLTGRHVRMKRLREVVRNIVFSIRRHYGTNYKKSIFTLPHYLGDAEYQAGRAEIDILPSKPLRLIRGVKLSVDAVLRAGCSVMHGTSAAAAPFAAQYLSIRRYYHSAAAGQTTYYPKHAVRIAVHVFRRLQRILSPVSTSQLWHYYITPSLILIVIYYYFLYFLVFHTICGVPCRVKISTHNRDVRVAK